MYYQSPRLSAFGWALIAGACLGEALEIKGVEVLILKGLADLHHAICPEVVQHHSVPVLRVGGSRLSDTGDHTVKSVNC